MTSDMVTAGRKLFGKVIWAGVSYCGAARGWNRCNGFGYSAIFSRHKAHHVKTRRHPRNRKYITYRNIA